MSDVRATIREGEIIVDSSKAAAVVRENAALRDALEDLLDRQHDYPTLLTPATEWAKAFNRARVALGDREADS